jgi:hypothetical protein
MDAIGTQVLHAEPADSVRWEPCLEPTGDDGGSLCSACGWPVDDHDLDRSIVPARAA